LQTSPCILAGTYVQLNAPLPEKTFILMTLRSPLDVATIIKIPGIDPASILKNPIINAGSESEIVIKLIENYFFIKN
jgi:hypothetical protein